MGRLFHLYFLCFGFLVRTAFSESAVKNVTLDEQKYYDLTVQLENYFKSAVKSATKSMLPNIISLQEDPMISATCLRSLTKYLMSLSRAKMWAVQSECFCCFQFIFKMTL